MTHEPKWLVPEDVCVSHATQAVRASASLAAACTALILSAYRHEEGREAATLAEVEQRFGWTAPKQPLTERPIDYIRLTPPANAVPGASGYALACWADGRAVAKGGGNVWLVVRNSAFGTLPFRVYSWQSRGGLHDNGGVSSNAIVVTAGPITKHQPDKALSILQVPAALFLPDPAGWDQGETCLREANWSSK